MNCEDVARVLCCVIIFCKVLGMAPFSESIYFHQLPVVISPNYIRSIDTLASGNSPLGQLTKELDLFLFQSVCNQKSAPSRTNQ